MSRTTPQRRTVGAILAAAALAALTGCIPLPSAPPPTAPASSTPASSTPATPSTAPSAEPNAEPSAGPGDAPYEYTTQVAPSGTQWSFEPTHAAVVPTDFDGTPADPGFKLVILYIDGELLGGAGNFYYDFRVASVNEATGQWSGLSSASDFYANEDLYTVGQQPSFQQAEAIYQLPEDWPIDRWRFIFHETGEEWEMDVPTS